MKLAVITGADGGMGTEITRAAAKAGYRIVMACYRPEKAEKVKDMLVRDTGNPHIEVLGVDLSSLASVAAFAEMEGEVIRLRAMYGEGNAEGKAPVAARLQLAAEVVGRLRK